jgi:hypothetical protein
MIDTPRKPAVHDQVLVEADVDGKVVGFRAVVVNTVGTALWLGLVKPDPRLENVGSGEPIALTFSCPDGGLVAESVFLAHLGPTRARLFSVRMPSDIRLTQRRAHLRLDTDCPIEYTIVSQSASGGAGLTGAGVTRNIGTGGLQFLVAVPMAETPIVADSLEVAVALGPDAVSAEAEVLRLEDATDLGPDWRPIGPANPPRPPRTLIAVRFTSIGEAAQDMIVRYIVTLQRSRR